MKDIHESHLKNKDYSTPKKAARIMLDSVKKEAGFTANDIKLAGLLNASSLVNIKSTLSDQSLKLLKEHNMVLQSSNENNGGNFSSDQIKLISQTELSISGASGVEQGPYNDCWLLASLSSIASTPKGQEAISKMIKPQSDGSYLVKFPQYPDKPILVTRDDLNQKNLSNSSKWANIIEAAAVKQQPDYAKTGALASVGLQLLTGLTPWNFQLTQNSNQKYLNGLADFLHKNLVEQKPVIANADVLLGKQKFVHSFAVLGVDNSTGLVLVRNPWGANRAGGMNKIGNLDIPQVETEFSKNQKIADNQLYNLGNGVIAMNIATFVNNFDDITFVQPTKLELANLVKAVNQ